MKFVISFCFSGILLSFFLISCENDIKKVKIIASQKEAQIERGKNVEIMYSDSGKTRLLIIAPTMIRHLTKNPYTEMPDKVNVYFYNDNTQVESKLKANYGIRYEKEQIMKVKDNVVLSNIKGEKLYAEELIWDEKQEKIYSDKFVKIVTPDEIIYGEGFESNQDFTDYRIKKIKGTINVQEEDIDNS